MNNKNIKMIKNYYIIHIDTSIWKFQNLIVKIELSCFTTG